MKALISENTLTEKIKTNIISILYKLLCNIHEQFADWILIMQLHVRKQKDLEKNNQLINNENNVVEKANYYQYYKRQVYE